MFIQITTKLLDISCMFDRYNDGVTNELITLRVGLFTKL